MQMKADTSHVLMSETLKGNVPELDGELPINDLKAKHVIVTAEKVVAAAKEGMVGILRGVLFGENPEIELRVDLQEALALVTAPGLTFNKFELHLGEAITPMPGPFLVKALRIEDISAVDQLCTLSLQLKRVGR